MRGKVCLITGATSGVGEATALGLARLGATTILVGRDPEKGRAAVARIASLCGDGNAAFLQADISSHAQVRDLAARVVGSYPRLDVLVNNAGAMFSHRRESGEGLEMTFAVNHLGPFLLTNLLRERLKASAPARIVNVSSVLHAEAKLDLSDLQSAKRYPATGMMPYNCTKLENLLFTYELARRLEGSGVTVNALGLGLTRTGLYRQQNIGLAGSLVMRLMTLFAPTAEKAGREVIHLASSPQVAGLTGKYFVHQRIVPSSEQSYDRESGERLWRVSAQLAGIDD